MNLPGSRTVKQYPWFRYFKYLLVVPILLVVGYSSYRYGIQVKSVETVGRNTINFRNCVLSFVIQSLSSMRWVYIYIVGRERIGLNFNLNSCRGRKGWRKAVHLTNFERWPCALVGLWRTCHRLPFLPSILEGGRPVLFLASRLFHRQSVYSFCSWVC